MEVRVRKMEGTSTPRAHNGSLNKPVFLREVLPFRLSSYLTCHRTPAQSQRHIYEYKLPARENEASDVGAGT